MIEGNNESVAEQQSAMQCCCFASLEQTIKKSERQQMATHHGEEQDTRHKVREGPRKGKRPLHELISENKNSWHKKWSQGQKIYGLTTTSQIDSPDLQDRPSTDNERGLRGYDVRRLEGTNGMQEIGCGPGRHVGCRTERETSKERVERKKEIKRATACTCPKYLCRTPKIWSQGFSIIPLFGFCSLRPLDLGDLGQLGCLGGLTGGTYNTG